MGMWNLSCDSAVFVTDRDSLCVRIDGGDLYVCLSNPAHFQGVSCIGFEEPTDQIDKALGGPFDAGNGLTVVHVPLWAPLLIAALPTAVLCWRDRRRIPPGHCPTCGYNLTGNVSGRCPECGQAVASGGQ
jgi:hypothetical protein